MLRRSARYSHQAARLAAQRSLASAFLHGARRGRCSFDSRVFFFLLMLSAHTVGGNQTIGFIGLGNMGLPMAHNFIKSGYDVLCFDVNQANVSKLVALGARPAASVEEMASQVTTVFSVLPNDEVLTRVAKGDKAFPGSGLIANLASGALHVSCSTIHPETSRDMDTKHKEKGASYVAAPIFARPDGMEAMQANFVISGSNAQAVESATEWLKCTSAGVYDFGNKDAGAANAVKLCGNFLIASAIESMAEALSLVEANGVDRVQAMQFYSNTFLNSVVHKGYGQRVSERDHRPGGFAMELGYKDQRLAHAMAMQGKVPMPFLSVLIDRFLSERAKGRSDLDWSAIGLGVCESRGVDVSEAIRRSRGLTDDTDK